MRDQNSKTATPRRPGTVIDKKTRSDINQSIKGRMKYSEASKKYEVSTGSITNIIKEFKNGQEPPAYERSGPKIGEIEARAYDIVVELAKLSGFNPWVLAKTCVELAGVTVKNINPVYTQIRRLLQKHNLLSTCKNKRSPGTIALHMVKAYWGDTPIPDCRGYLLLAMDLGTGKLEANLHDRISDLHILNCIDNLEERDHIKCNRIVFTTYMEKRRTGAVQVSAIRIVTIGKFRRFLERRLLDSKKGKVQIVAGNQVVRNRKWIPVEGVQNNPKAIIASIKEWLDKYAGVA